MRAKGAVILALTIAACGGEGPAAPTPANTALSPDPAPLSPPPPPPRVLRTEIDVAGNGPIVLHPSALDGFATAVEFPLFIQETGGGTASWSYFRVSYFVNGVEVERNELGADAIEAQGFRDVNAHATITPTMTTPTNDAFWSLLVTEGSAILEEDHIEIRLGFSDSLDGRLLERTLNLFDFDGIVLSQSPAPFPGGNVDNQNLSEAPTRKASS